MLIMLTLPTKATAPNRMRRMSACVAFALVLSAGVSPFAFGQELQRAVPPEERGGSMQTVPGAGMPNERGTDLTEDVSRLGDRISNLFGGGETGTEEGGPEADAVSAACNRTDLNAEQMRELQTGLAAIWGDAVSRPGPADGICGPRTLRSVTMFQRAQGLPDDGIPSAALLERVREVQANAGERGATPAESQEGAPGTTPPESRPAAPAATTPSAPDAPSAPGTPAAPNAPATPSADAPDTPSLPDAPDASSVPSAPEVPAAPSTPDAPSLPNVPAAPETPNVPAAPTTPGTTPTPARP